MLNFKYAKGDANEEPRATDMTFQNVRAACMPYGYKVLHKFGYVYIRTRFECWYFQEPECGNVIKLMHGNLSGNHWHSQFKQEITPEDLALFLHEHETGKYIGYTKFHFPNLGSCREVKAAALS